MVDWTDGLKISHTRLNQMQMTWKSSTATAFSVNNQAAGSIAETTLDLTSYTSANARMAYLQLMINVDTLATAPSYHYLYVKDNIQGIAQELTVGPNDSAIDYYQQIIVGLDANQECLYAWQVGTNGQCDMWIKVMGYWE